MMKQQLAVIMVLLVTLFIGFGMIIPVMPELVSPFHLSWLLAIYSGLSFVLAPLWGALSDRIGRKPVIMIGAIGFCLSFVLFGFAVDKLWLMYVSRILGGIFSGAATACAVAYVADITSEQERTKGMGLVGMSIGLGFIGGPAFGGLLSGINIQFPFFAAAVISFCTFVICARWLPESLTPLQRSARRARSSGKTSRWAAFRGPLKYLYLLSFVVSFTLAGLEATFQYFQMARIGVTPAQMGMMFLVSGVVGAAIQGGVVRRMVKPGQEGVVIRIGLLVSATGFFLILLSDSLLTATLFLTVFAAGNALIRPCVISLITQKTTVGQGVATGLITSMDSLGRIMGPLLGAALFAVHVQLPFVAGGVFCLGALLFLARYLRLERQAVAS